MWDDPPSKHICLTCFPGAHWCPLVPFFSALPCLATTTIFGYGSLDITAKDGAKTVEEWEFFRSSLHVVPIDSVFFLNQQEPQKQLPSSKPTVCYGKCSLKMVSFHRIVSRSPMISALFQSPKISENSRRDVWGHHLAFETWITITWRSRIVREIRWGISALGKTVAGLWFGTWISFFHILGIVTPSEFHIFQRGWNHHQTDWQWNNFHIIFPIYAH